MRKPIIAILLLMLGLLTVLSGCTPAVPAADTEPETPAAESPRPEEVRESVTFPAASALLDGACEPFAPLADDGSRQVTVRYTDAGDAREAVYALTETPEETGGPTLTLRREWLLSSVIYKPCRPVTDAAARAWLLDMIDQADFQPEETDTPMWSMVLDVTDAGTERTYYICADGTLCRQSPEGAFETAAQAVDYLRLSALAYQYAAGADDIGAFPAYGWLNRVELEKWETPPAAYADWWEEAFPLPPASHYRLCVQSEGFHADLDRAQADVLLTALFGETGNGGAMLPEFTPAELDWSPESSGVRLTEYLLIAGTEYDGAPQYPDGVMWQTLYLYPDGTAARLPLAGPSYWHYGAGGVESVTPSWQRAAVAAKAFAPETLDACLRGLENMQAGENP